MYVFLSDTIFTLTVFTIYGFIGGFSLIPFRHQIRYPILAAPMAGMLLWAMGVFIIYSFAGLSVETAAIITGIIYTTITIASLIYLKPTIYWHDVFFISILVVIMAAICTYLSNFTSIKFGHTGFLFREGSDHLGYAIMADWLNAHLVKQLPIVNPSVPYQSFPALLAGNDHEILINDPRFGSFFSLAIISLLFGQSSTFSYDIACGIILLTSYLGISTLYSRTPKILVLLLLSFFTSFWFVLSRTGYFGKIMGFPSIIFILGFYFLQQDHDDATKENKFCFIVTLALTFAAAMVYPGFVLAAFLIIVGGLFLVFKSIDIGRNLNHIKLIKLRDDAGLLFVMILIAFAAPGLLSVPRYFLPLGMEFPLSWYQVFLTQLDLRPLAYDEILTWYTPYVSTLFLIGSVLIITLSLFITLIKRNIIASTLLGSVIIFLILPYLLGDKWLAYELTASIYPLSVCGCAWYLGELELFIKNKNLTSLFILTMMLAIGIRIPSFIESIHRYVAYGVPPSMQYSKKELDYLADKINTAPVLVDIPNVMFALPILVEFGRRDMNLQWTPNSWKAILGYRNWQAPKIQSNTRLILGLTSDALTMLNLKPELPSNCDIIAKTRQFQLFSCKDLNVTKTPFTYQKNQMYS